MNKAINPADAPVTGSIYEDYPDKSGYFGIFGGVFIAQTLMDPISELQEAYETYRKDPQTLHDKLFTMVNGMRKSMDDVQVTA